MPTKKKGNGTHYDRMLVDYDEKQRAIDLSSWNLVPPETGIFDAPTRCYQINEEWAKIVMGFVGWLASPAPWRDADNDSFPACEEILKFLIGGSCMSEFQLRQNVDNPCLLEQSTDNGVTWSTAFDYSLCLDDRQESVDLDELIDRLNQLLQNYDGNVDSIAPDMIYDTTSTDDIRDIALCQACHELVDAICEAELQRRNEIALGAAVTGVVLGIVAAVITVFSGGTATVAALALASALAGGFATVFDGVNEAVLTDDVARGLVACCMYESLKSATITQSAFEASLSGCMFTELTPEAQIAGAIASLLTADDMFVTFVDLMQRTYKLAEIGIADCPCDDGTWTSVLDFTTSDYGIIFDNPNGTSQGSWSNGVGLVAVDDPSAGPASHILAGTILFGGSGIATSWEIEGSYTKGTTNDPSGTAIGFNYRYQGNGTSTAVYSQTFAQLPAGTSDLARSKTFAETNVDGWRVYARSSRDALDGSVTLTQVTLSGTGTKPAGLP